LSRRAQYEDVKRTCEKYGRVINVDIKDGFGFVEFDSPRGAAEAVEGLKDIKFDGDYWEVHYAKGPKPSFPSKGRGDFRIRVEGIDRRTSWQDLKDFARGAGEVVYADVAEDSRGDKYGVIEYLTEAEFNTALKKLDGAELDEKKVRLVPEKSASSSSARPRDPSPAYDNGGRRSRSRSPIRHDDVSPPRGGRSRSGDRPQRSRTPELKRDY
jgi:splicing factor, arginine/serine-rich 4/5/6